MEINDINKKLKRGNEQEKLYLLSHLSDIFEFNKQNIDHFEEIIDILIDCAINEKSATIQSEIFETLVKAAIYQDIHKINFSLLENNLNELPVDCLSRGIDVLSFTHNIRYLPSITKYSSHSDDYVRASVAAAIMEIMGS